MPFFRLRNLYAVESTQRIEAFSDGVFAIAITLLILEIKVPHAEDGGLGRALLELWPSYFAYLLSFVMIGIYWVNHHYIFQFYQRADHVFALLNVFFLLCISFLPFPTAVLAEYLTHAESNRAATTIYAIGLLLPALAWLLTWLYGSADHRLIDRRLDAGFVSALTRQYLGSVALYVVALVASFSLPRIGLGICVGLTLLYLLPPKKPVYQVPFQKE